MDNKLTEKQEDKIHGGMILLDSNNIVYLIDETNYEILFQCTFGQLSFASIPKYQKRWCSLNISEVTDLDNIYNDSYLQEINAKNNHKHPHTYGRLPSGFYRKIVKGQDGSPKVLDGFVNIP